MTPHRRRFASRFLLLAGVSALVTLVAPATTRAEYANPDGVAVIIGNRTYGGDIPAVDFAHRDAEAFRRYVLDVLGFDPENIIDLRDTTQAEMWSTFGSRTTADRSELWSYLADEGSDVVVFYSGHGVPGIDDERGYLLPVNADPNTAELNGYPIDVLFENLANLKLARSIAVYLDACFSGGSGGGGMLIEGASPVYVEASLPDTGTERLTVLTAASDKQLASWDRTARHGLFTHHLLEALYGKADRDVDGRVTAREAKAYLDRYMTRAAKRTWKRRQRAGLKGNVDAVLAKAGAGVAFPPRPVLGDEEPGPAAALIPGTDDEPVSPGAPSPPQAEEIARSEEKRLGLRQADWITVQHGLASSGFATGTPDGLPGKRTRTALRAWQKQKGLEETGYLAVEQWEYLAEKGKEAQGEERRRREEEARAEQERREAERRADDAAFARARRSDTVESYGRYLAAHPGGRHVAEAKRHISNSNSFLHCLDTRQRGSRGWSYKGRTTSESTARSWCSGWLYMSLECPTSGGYEVFCVDSYDTTGTWAEVPAAECKGSPSASHLNGGANGHCVGPYRVGDMWGGGWHRGALYQLGVDSLSR